MIRVEPERHDDLVQSPDVRPVMKGTRPMPGFFYVGRQAIKSDDDLEKWINLALAYNRTLPGK